MPRSISNLNIQDSDNEYCCNDITCNHASEWNFSNIATFYTAVSYVAAVAT